MPRATQDPFLRTLQYFEEAPLTSLPLALTMVKEVVRRRTTGETVIRADGAYRIDPPAPVKKKKVRGPGKKKAAPAQTELADVIGTTAQQG